MEFPVLLNLPDALLRELTSAAAECRCEPSVFAAQVIEATLAARRLPTVAAGRCGARVPGWVPEPEQDPKPEIDENFSGPLEPLDIPAAADLESLEGIGD